MNRLNSASIAPCLFFFASRRPARGILALLMQISLILWPAASRWAQAVQSQDLIQQLLAEVSDIYRPLQNVAAGPAYPVIKQKRQQPA